MVTEKLKWKKVVGFPDYIIHVSGQVKNVRTGKIVTAVGPVKSSVNLSKDGKQYLRGIRKLTRAHFGEESKL